MEHDLDTMIGKIKALFWDCDAGYIGLRSDDRVYSVGDALPESRVWDNGIPTDEMLGGTCCTGLFHAEDVCSMIEFNIREYNHGQPLYLIGGDSCAYGEDAGEIIIPDAHVIARLR